MPHESKLVVEGTNIEIMSDIDRYKKVNITAISIKAIQLMD